MLHLKPKSKSKSEIHSPRKIMVKTCKDANLFHDFFGNVIDSFSVKSKAIRSITSINQTFDIVSNVLGEFLKEDFGLLLC